MSKFSSLQPVSGEKVAVPVYQSLEDELPPEHFPDPPAGYKWVKKSKHPDHDKGDEIWFEGLPPAPEGYRWLDKTVHAKQFAVHGRVGGLIDEDEQFGLGGKWSVKKGEHPHFIDDPEEDMIIPPDFIADFQPVYDEEGGLTLKDVRKNEDELDQEWDTLVGEAFMEAIAADNYTQVLHLARNDAPLNKFHPKRKATALFITIADLHERAFWALLKAGANPLLGDEKGFTPLQLAVFKGYPDMVRTLMTYDEVHMNSYSKLDGATAFHRACRGPDATHTSILAHMLKEPSLNISSTTRPDAKGDRHDCAALIKMSGNKWSHVLYQKFLDPNFDPKKKEEL
eukprot:CAMPEP_0197862006 /NCGR_PEP_ID=MMETSP1438-20131217/38403_1 /TAXON_ID=1461541 /ORGANISM="Pterosperma sp., Strain CCMP1384" /LENGTH=339 /DNA_ID=CAMNT_0043479385 /DNA_START=226 /DNA_END=1246 /DNA_ORIENTATION=+